MSKLLNERLKLYLEAERVLNTAGQSYTIGSRTLTRANLSEVRAQIDKLIAAGATTSEDNGFIERGSRSKQVIFRD
ncbi:DUF6148 family protein [Megamonas hypermegale]|uniref:DUF6148 family protein n=1 Tax=Megamonas hypermegale TaxID=158847 RepID=UPI0026EC9C6D|nr:DUF6148 family protein [Megamonas hypermegale]